MRLLAFRKRLSVIKKRKENINNGKTEITKQVLKVRRGFLEITRKVSCMPRMFCMKKRCLWKSRRVHSCLYDKYRLRIQGRSMFFSGRSRRAYGAVGTGRNE